MDVARLNFSHGVHADHGRRFHEVRQAAAAAGRNVAVLADLQGPKIRLGRFAEGPVEWATGERVRITVEDCEGTHDRVSTTYKQLADDVRPGRQAAGRRRQRRAGRGRRSRTAPTSSATSPRAAWSATTRACRCPASRSACRRCRTRTPRTSSSPCGSGWTSSRCPSSAQPEDVKLVHRVMDAGRHPPAGHRQAREAGGGRRARGHRARVRRHDGRARRPRRRDAARAGAGRAEAGDPDLPRQREAGHRRDADARVDDHPLAPDPRRGVRRRERGHRRCRRGHALRRDERRHVIRCRPSPR